jgi:hypothetical protein
MAQYTHIILLHVSGSNKDVEQMMAVGVISLMNEFPDAPFHARATRICGEITSDDVKEAKKRNEHGDFDSAD